MVLLFHLLVYFQYFHRVMYSFRLEKTLRTETVKLFMTVLYFSVVKAVDILNTLVSVSLESGLNKPTILII